LFWLDVRRLDIAAVRLMAYNRAFAADTPSTNARARTIMIGVYVLLLLVSCWFFYSSAFADRL